MSTKTIDMPIEYIENQEQTETGIDEARRIVASIYTRDMRRLTSVGEYEKQSISNFEQQLIEQGVAVLSAQVAGLSTAEVDDHVQRYLDQEFDGVIRGQIDENIDKGVLYRMRRKLGEFLNRGNKITKLAKKAIITATSGVIGGVLGGTVGSAAGAGLAAGVQDMADHRFNSLASRRHDQEDDTTDRVVAYERLEGDNPVERLEQLFRLNAEARRLKLEADIASERKTYQRRLLRASGKAGLAAAAAGGLFHGMFGEVAQAHAAPLDTPSADVGLGGGVDTVDVGLGPDVVHADTVDVDLGSTDTANVDIGSSFESGHPTKLGGGLLSDPTETVDIDLGPSEAGVDSVETVEVGLGPDEVSTETVEVGLGPDEVSTETVEVGLGPDDASVESGTETVEVGLGPDEAPTETVEVGLGPDSGDVSTSDAESHVGGGTIEIKVPSDLSLRSGEGGWETLEKLGVPKSEWNDLWQEIGDEIRKSDFKKDVYPGVDGHWRWSYPGPVKPEVADIMRRVISEHRF